MDEILASETAEAEAKAQQGFETDLPFDTNDSEDDADLDLGDDEADTSTTTSTNVQEAQGGRCRTHPSKHASPSSDGQSVSLDTTQTSRPTPS
ncbi:MAG: hypothetical protein R2857_09780 [Vampirovibrionales bacterium]